MIRHVLAVGPLGSNCIVLADEDTHEAVVVDPGGDAARIIAAVQAARLRVVAILHTHGHIDHISASAELARATGAPTYLHPDDSFLVQLLPEQAGAVGFARVERCRIDHALADGDVVAFGRHRIRVLHTPGHSPGSVSLLVEGENLCLTGDTLFEGGVGRTDLWGGDAGALSHSIRSRLYTLSPDVEVIPGHGPSTTIERERSSNPFVSVDALV